MGGAHATAPTPLDVTLRVRSLADVVPLYVRALGLQAKSSGQAFEIGPPDGRPFLRLIEDADAPPRTPYSTGLYHLAILFPDRASLGATYARLLEKGVPFEGTADHGVSEAIYLRDPEGNGIELYADRPRDAWPGTGDDVEMWTRPLDRESLLAGSSGAAPVPAGATLGHLHFHVGDLDEAERFYTDVLGLEVMVRTYPGALFLATGGYHHHVGVNTWVGDTPSLPGAAGLIGHTWEGSAEVIEVVAERGRQAGLVSEDGRGLTDPVGARVALATRG